MAVKRIEFEDVDAPKAQSMVNKKIREFFVETSKATVRDPIYRLLGVYHKYRARYPWNHIVSVGMRLYSLQRAGIQINIQLARSLNKFNLPDDVLSDIVSAISGGGQGGGQGGSTI